MTPADGWPAPVAQGPLDASVRLPGSKSLSARYLVLAALADGPSRLSGLLEARDSQLMRDGLSALGVSFAGSPPNAVSVYPPARLVVSTPSLVAGPAPSGATGLAGATGAVIDVGLAGTVMRFLAPVAALAAGETRFVGDQAAARRPMAPLFDALQQLGIALERPKDGQSLPFSVLGLGAVKGGSVSLDSSLSSQFLSALLLAAPRFQTGLTVRLAPATLPSRPHVDMTVSALRRFGATVRLEGHSTWRIEPGGLKGQDLTIEPDLSNAAPFLAAALVAGGSVRVPGWPATSDQPGGLLRDYLAAFGASVSYEEAAPSPPPASGTGQLTVKAEPGQIKGVDLDLSRAGELAPTLAALAALAVGPSRLGGIGHLKGHETDRLRALTSEINRLGGRARETADGLEIEPAPLHGALVRTYGDHRMATFGALIGLAVPGVSVEDVGVTAKTLPTFPQLWREMLGL